MRGTIRSLRGSVVLVMAVSMCVLLGVGGLARAADIPVTLTGGESVPAVMTSAGGSGTITVGEDRSVSGSVTTTGIVGTAAHIHLAAAGQNGPVAIPLTKTGEATWTVPAGAKLTEDQYTAYAAGKLYVNVHSAAHPGGEIRGQLKP